MHLKLDEFLILDTETTGLPNQGGEIVEISIIDQDGNVLFDSLVKPKGKIGARSKSIHGIDERMVSDAPTFDLIYPAISEIITGKDVLIYNKNFDDEILVNCCALYALLLLRYKSHCVMNWYKKSMKLANNATLEKASGIKITHRSLGDCFATLSVYNKLAESPVTDKVSPSESSLRSSVETNKYPPSKKTRTEIVCEYYMSGKTIYEIANIENIKEQTTIDHLFKGFSMGIKISVDGFINRENENKITELLKSSEDGRLKPVFESLGGLVSYNEIRAVKLKYNL